MGTEAKHLVAITNEARNSARIAKISSEFDFNYSVHRHEDSDSLESDTSVLFSVIFMDEMKVSGSLGEKVQLVKYLFPNSFILLVSRALLSDDAVNFVKKSGANAIILEEEIDTTSKIEYLSTQIIRTTFLPIKTIDIKIGTKIPFDLYALLPKNKKFLKVFQAGFEVDGARFHRMDAVNNEWFIHRSQIDSLRSYLKSFSGTPDSFESQCRADYLKLRSDFLDLVIALTDKSSTSSFNDGKKLLEKCTTTCDELISTIKNVTNIDKIIERTSVQDFGSLERTPAIVLTVGYYAMRAKNLDANKLVFGALVSDLGLISIPYFVNRKLKDSEPVFTQEESAYLHSHPIASLNTVMARKIQLTDEMKRIILCSHENLSRTGYPERPMPDKIPIESQYIQFATELDSRTQIRLGEIKKDRVEELERLLKSKAARAELSFAVLKSIASINDLEIF